MDAQDGTMAYRRVNKLKIRAWRKFRGLTQAQLADATGLTDASVSRIETGVQAYTRQTLEVLSEALKCEPEDLIGHFEPGSPELDLIYALRKMTPAERGRVAQVVRLLRESSAA